MSIKTKPKNNGQQEQQIEVSPQTVIDSLMQRVQQLTVECVMKDAIIAQLQAKEHDAQTDAASSVPS